MKTCFLLFLLLFSDLLLYSTDLLFIVIVFKSILCCCIRSDVLITVHAFLTVIFFHISTNAIKRISINLQQSISKNSHDDDKSITLYSRDKIPKIL